MESLYQEYWFPVEEKVSKNDTPPSWWWSFWS